MKKIEDLLQNQVGTVSQKTGLKNGNVLIALGLSLGLTLFWTGGAKMPPLVDILKKIRPTSGRRPEGGLTSILFQFCMFQRRKLSSQVFEKKIFQISLKEGHHFPYKFQQILQKVENYEEQLPFISDENNYSKRSYGFFRSQSSLSMISTQDFSQILFVC